MEPITEHHQHRSPSVVQPSHTWLGRGRPANRDKKWRRRSKEKEPNYCRSRQLGRKRRPTKQKEVALMFSPPFCLEKLLALPSLVFLTGPVRAETIQTLIEPRKQILRKRGETLGRICATLGSEGLRRECESLRPSVERRGRHYSPPPAASSRLLFGWATEAREVDTTLAKRLQLANSSYYTTPPPRPRSLQAGKATEVNATVSPQRLHVHWSNLPSWIPLLVVRSGGGHGKRG